MLYFLFGALCGAIMYRYLSPTKIEQSLQLPLCPHPWQVMTMGNSLVLINRDHKPLQVMLDAGALVVREIEHLDRKA